MSVGSLFPSIPTGTGPTGSVDTTNSGASVPSKTFRYAGGNLGDLTSVYASDDGVNWALVGQLVGPADETTKDVSAINFMAVRDRVADPTAPAPAISITLESPTGGTTSSGSILGLGGTQEVNTTPVGLDTSLGGAEVKTTIGNITVHLPSLSSLRPGSGWFIKKVTADSNTVIIAPDAADLIDGANLSVVLHGFNESVMLRANPVGGTGFPAQWDIVADALKPINSLDVMANPAAGIGHVPVEYVIPINGPGNNDIHVVEAFDVHTTVFQKTDGNGGAGDTVQLATTAGNITEVMSAAGVIGSLVRNTFCDQTHFAIPAGGLLRGVAVQGGADVRGALLVQGWKR